MNAAAALRPDIAEPVAAPTRQAPVLAVSDLAVSFRSGGVWRKAVNGVSFSLGEAETLAVVGESGSGKSAMALAVMRLLPKGVARVGGHVALAGVALESLSEKAMRDLRGADVGMIFQEPMTSLNPVLTIGTQIAEALIRHRDMSKADARGEATRLLQKVRLPAASSRFDDYPHQLSGGMRQRVMIAMALACKPKLLIADEPTTALDVTVQAQILDLLKVLQDEEGMSILFITHDMGVVAEIAQRVLVMKSGDIVEEGTAADIFADPREAYTRTLLRALPRLGSMRGRPLPMRFSLGDDAAIPEMPDTVAHAGTPLLDVAGLTARFDIRAGGLSNVVGRIHAVENVSFSLRAGETLALVGESGCGKSTTGRAVLRLVEAQAGTVRLDGEDVLAMPKARLRDRRRLMQMVFQDPYASINPRVTVGAAIAQPMLVHALCGRREAEARVAAALTRVGLQPDMAARFPHEFSGGQRQRICIARALALEPKMIVADEAVSALDASIKAQVVNLMLDLQASLGLAFLFISHDMAVVERISHRVAVMYLGEIVEIGPREAIFGDPQHPYTKKLLAAVPVPDPSRRSVRRPVSNDEIGSALRPLDYQPPVRSYRQVSPGHLVQEG